MIKKNIINYLMINLVKKYYNKTTINKYKKYKKYKTININFIKAKSNLYEKIEINYNYNINNNQTLNNNYIFNNNYTLNTQNTSSYINHTSEGNSINNNNNYKSSEKSKKSSIDNKNKIPLLNSKINQEKEKKKHNYLRNCLSAKTRHKASSENRPNKYYNNNELPIDQKIIIQNPNNYQYKKIILINRNTTNDDTCINLKKVLTE